MILMTSSEGALKMMLGKLFDRARTSPFSMFYKAESRFLQFSFRFLDGFSASMEAMTSLKAPLSFSA
jgi:type III secretory pathway component EscT